MNMNKIELIPQQYRELAQDLTQLAKKYNLMSLSGKIRPGFKSDFREDITYHWDSGRHGVDVRKIRLTFEHQTIVDLEEQ